MAISVKYIEELAREIIQTKETSDTSSFSLKSDDNEFIEYEDDYIEIFAAKNKKAMEIRITDKLAESNNPILYMDDEGEIYRLHGEHIYFIMYAELLLNKQETLWESDYLQEKQKKIFKGFKK